MLSRRASYPRPNRETVSKPQPRNITHFWRFANGSDYSEGANHKTAAEREHEQ
jgi:hypothetical protein